MRVLVLWTVLLEFLVYSSSGCLLSLSFPSSPLSLLSVVCLSYVTLPRSNVYFKKSGDFPLLNSRLCAFVQKFWIVRSAPDMAREIRASINFTSLHSFVNHVRPFDSSSRHDHTSTFNFNKPSSRDECERWNSRFFELLFMFISITLCRFVYFCALGRPVSSLSLCAVMVALNFIYLSENVKSESAHTSPWSEVIGLCFRLLLLPIIFV